MSVAEYYDKGFILGEKLVQVITYNFIGFGIVSALLVMLIFTVAWTKNV